MAAASPAAVCVAAHPNDLDGCTGTMILLGRQGYDLHVVGYTHGERGACRAALTDDSTPEVRLEEERQACAKLGAKLHYLNECEGDAYAPRRTIRELTDLLEAIRPSVVFTHWPLDTNADHVMACAAVHRAVSFMQGAKPEIVYMETPDSSVNFQPQHWVYINHVRVEKADVSLCRKSQNKGNILVKGQRRLSEERGRDVWTPARHCEAFASFLNRAYGRPPVGMAPKVFADLERPVEKSEKKEAGK